MRCVRVPWVLVWARAASAHVAEFSLPTTLQDLDLSANVIADVAATATALAPLRHLTSLVVANNPVAAYPGYRETMLGAVPTLKSIDHRCVTWPCALSCNACAMCDRL